MFALASALTVARGIGARSAVYNNENETADFSLSLNEGSHSRLIVSFYSSLDPRVSRAGENQQPVQQRTLSR